MSRDKQLIIHADDLGMCHSVNEASRRAMSEGVVSSASVMVPCPWFPEIAEWARCNSELDLGVHLTLTSEWRHYRWRPVAPLDQVRSLLDADGYLHRSTKEVRENSTAHEVLTELRAQVQRALDFGMQPSHIDTHMGTVFAHPGFFQAYIQVAREFHIVPMLPKPTPEAIAMGRQMGIDLGETVEELQQQRFPMFDVLVTSPTRSTAYADCCDEFHSVLRNVKPGVTQIIVHLSENDREIQGVTETWEHRYFEYLICTDTATRELIADLGIHLIGFTELR